jgi:DNA end-binding protein Ku
VRVVAVAADTEESRSRAGRIGVDVLIDRDDLDGLPDAEELKVSDREVAMAQQLIESLSGDFEPDKYKDQYREKVLELIEKKAQGEEIAVAPEAPAPAKVPDLMAALEASLAAVRTDDEKPKRKSSKSSEREKAEAK